MKASFLTNESHVEFNTSQDCVTDRTEMDYLGFKSRTTKGVKCHHWDELSEMTGSHFSIHENYCRNFNNEIVPWCFTENTREFQYCDIPLCSKRKNFHLYVFLFKFDGIIFVNELDCTLYRLEFCSHFISQWLFILAQNYLSLYSLFHYGTLNIFFLSKRMFRE